MGCTCKPPQPAKSQPRFWPQFFVKGCPVHKIQETQKYDPAADRARPRNPFRYANPAVPEGEGYDSLIRRLRRGAAPRSWAGSAVGEFIGEEPAFATEVEG